MLVKQNVLGLDVSMQNPLLMKMLHCEANLPKNPKRLKIEIKDYSGTHLFS